MGPLISESAIPICRVQSFGGVYYIDILVLAYALSDAPMYVMLGPNDHHKLLCYSALLRPTMQTLQKEAARTSDDLVLRECGNQSL